MCACRMISNQTLLLNSGELRFIMEIVFYRHIPNFASILRVE